jgi:hypothetical protein
MANLGISAKRLQIDKANSTVTLIVALAAFITIFGLFMSRSLLAKQSFQSRVIREKSKTLKQLEANIEAVDKLKVSYAEFVDRSDNIIGGLTEDGQSERDGDNAKITLDALPSKYDFPALTTSLEKLLLQRNFKIESITGTDDEVAQQSNSNDPNPEPVEMPFTLSVVGSYDPAIELLKVFEKSIRPIQVLTVTFTADQQEVQLDIEAKTFYLPEKNLNLQTKVVK